MVQLTHRALAGLIAATLVAPLVGACTSRSEPVPTTPSAAAGIAPALVIERFLQAANSQDLQTMARLFGTREGSILNRDPRTEVEQRMYALASVLRHQNYTLAGESVVPGRLGEAVQLSVRMQLTDREVVVPFIVVHTKGDGWLIEQIDIEKITLGR